MRSCQEEEGAAEVGAVAEEDEDEGCAADCILKIKNGN